MLYTLLRVQGKALVIFSPEDKAAVKAVEAYLQCLPVGAASATSAEALSKVRSEEYGLAVVFCADLEKYINFDMLFLQQCLEKLRPGGFVIARLGGLSNEQASKLETVGLFAGAVNSMLGAKVPNKITGLLEVEFSCSKPSWSSGAAASLPGFGAERIDEDALLGEVPAPVGKGKSDCSSQPKACANCSCGRKELEDKFGAEEAKTRLEQGKERSSCGSCYLGDAFRCETCPYRGLPAFKPGSKVELSAGETASTGQLSMQIGADGDEVVGSSTNGKLTINIG